MDQWKNRLWEILEAAKPGDRVSRAFDIFILSLIVLNVTCSVISTVSSIYAACGKLFDAFELFSVIVFTVEYLLRLFACTADPAYAHPIKGRLRFIRSPMAIIDLCAILPFYLPFLDADLRSLRILRLFRLFRLAKLARYSASLRLMKEVLVLRKEELLLSLGMTLSLLLISSCLLYYVENPVQPEAFSSIPATMWWSVATLTTVGYGDIYPITALGRLFAGITAFLGVGLFALPTAIIGSGFIEVIQKRKKTPLVCPHCGNPLA